MKKKFSTIVKRVWITCTILLIVLPAIAQDEKISTLITDDQINKITEIVKPLKDQFNKQLGEDRSGTYQAYLEDVKKLNAAKSEKERNSMANMMTDKYASFFKNLWSSVRVDEKAYQDKIRQVFPDAIGRQVQFQSFLSFSITNSTFIGALNRAFEQPAGDKCIDVCGIAAGEIKASSDLITGGAGSYGNCYLNTNSWAAHYGKNEVWGYLRNGITIPGTFPDDSKHLRVKVTFSLNQNATTFAGGGAGLAESTIRTFQNIETLAVYAPLFWVVAKFNIKTITENYPLLKRNVDLSIFKSYSGTMAVGLSGSWSHCSCTSINWSICEEK